MSQIVKSMKTSLETTDDGNEDNIQQTQIYAKKSFNRFGDELFGHILSYLTFKDRFQYECVSKRFQRRIFESVVYIDIYAFNGFIRQNTTIAQTLATIARKCPNIETIDSIQLREFYGSVYKVLTIFHNSCQYLRQIYCLLRSDYYQLIQRFGPMMTRIHVYDPLAKHSLIQCHRLSHLRVYHHLSDVFDTTSGQLLANNLHTFSFNHSLTASGVLFEAFIAGNQTLKSLTIYPSIDCSKNMNEVTERLSRLPQLRELTLHLHLTDCQTLNSLPFCPQLKRLKLDLKEEINPQMLDPLKHCRRLTHLTIHSIGPKFDTNSLFNCGNHWPRLQYLSIEDWFYERGVGFLSHISRLPALQTLKS
ncbi:unnamed protein product [Medioppia subpectinata]|uniref:F-box domain-containing protein n=1 Tax=Medioppia subpectinata TaxID=1979941 RepID=A0A7R9KJA6_9ACAR|nr:unnamed protein product [Medioppia subpectinata]CAG2103214.1 unnamed protein product [Medioppia subpectinata]